MTTKVTDLEYLFLSGGIPSDETDDLSAWYRAGYDCYENGWIDHLGFVTPSGTKAMEEYENDLQTS